MRSIIARAASGGLALACLFVLPTAVSAQAFWGGDADRGFGRGTFARYDGAPFSHRYHYYVGPVFYPGMNAQHLWDLYYLDRLDRAERFGYRPPPPPQPVRPLFRRFRAAPPVEWVEPVPGPPE